MTNDELLKLALERDLMTAMAKFLVRYPDVQSETETAVALAWEKVKTAQMHAMNNASFIIH